VRPRRDANGYRQYDDAELRVVNEIRARLAAGFGLGDIRPFVECLRAGNESGHVCPDSVVVLRRKLAEVDGYLDQLTEVRDRLRAQLTEVQQTRAQQTRAQGNRA
jgi:DNA-binding transcriptional MerR regulator